jgi:RluA family pseudouridine synthase
VVINAEVIFEDENLVAVNKPSGMLTEGGVDREDDLEQFATRHVGKPVLCCHRLDRLTSGAVILRKNGRYKAELAALFEQRQIRKSYWAIVAGNWPTQTRRIETQVAPLGNGVWANVKSGGKTAVSTFQILGKSPERNLTWLNVLLKTGRTHQARLHCLKGGCPILGDPVYGSKKPAELFGLHARELRFLHPATNENLELIAPPPLSWDATLASINR